MRRVRVRRREGERRMKIAPLAARCACGRTGPAALAPLFRDRIRETLHSILIFETSIKKIAMVLMV